LLRVDHDLDRRECVRGLRDAVVDPRLVQLFGRMVIAFVGGVKEFLARAIIIAATFSTARRSAPLGGVSARSRP